ncbi:MAG: hypothetical protein ABSB71_09955 [Candidatus Bathyarchaeia archaeon]|jgi:hypothetical protein
MTTQKSLLIHGPLKDLGDLLSIARAEGSKVLGCEKVNVSPQVFCTGTDFVVIVSPKEMVVQNSQVACGKSKNKI